MSALTDTFSDIADAIREKTGESDLISPSDMASAIAGIVGGSDLNVIMIPQIITGDVKEYVYNFQVKAKCVFFPAIGEFYDLINNKMCITESLFERKNLYTDENNYTTYNPEMQIYEFVNGTSWRNEYASKYTANDKVVYQTNSIMSFEITKNGFKKSASGTVKGNVDSTWIAYDPPKDAVVGFISQALVFY